MTKEELEKEAEEWLSITDNHLNDERTHFLSESEYAEQAYLAGAEPREKRIKELEAQIEKMKNCKNCANYMISGKCPCFFRTGWCKNWEMTK